MFKDLQINSKTFAAAQMKRMIHEFDGKMSTDDMDKVYAEIESTDWDAWFDTMQLAFLGRAAMAPESAAIVEADDKGGIPNTNANTGPTKGKDTATAASTPQRGQSSSAEIQKESKK
jgi:hypothetical protein